jgi:glycosyltransferase involved in cell wall biosynthesis
MQRDRAPTVRVHIASINTASATELCIRSAHRFAGYPFELTVGDTGSTDGSLETLRALERHGWLTLEVSATWRFHSEWLDRWLVACQADYAVFVDSDVEFRRPGWLRDLVTTARRARADMVCAEFLTEQRNFVEPSERRLTVRLMPRPSPWLLLVDAARMAGLQSSFAHHEAPAPKGPESALAFDVGGRLLHDARANGLNCLAMPASYQGAYHHYGGLSWPAMAEAYGWDVDPYPDREAKLREVERRLRQDYSAEGFHKRAAG